VTFGGADASGPRDDLATFDLLLSPGWTGDPTTSHGSGWRICFLMPGRTTVEQLPAMRFGWGCPC
jgi:hypothetical protein